MQGICMINVRWSYGFCSFINLSNYCVLCLSLTGDFDIVMVSRLPLLESSSISMDYIQGANVHVVVCSKICIVDDILWYIRPRGV